MEATECPTCKHTCLDDDLIINFDTYVITCLLCSDKTDDKG